MDFPATLPESWRERNTSGNGAVSVKEESSTLAPESPTRWRFRWGGDRTATLTSTELQRTRQAVSPGESQRHHGTHEQGFEVVAQYSEGSNTQVEERSDSVMIHSLPAGVS